MADWILFNAQTMSSERAREICDKTYAAYMAETAGDDEVFEGEDNKKSLIERAATPSRGGEMTEATSMASLPAVAAREASSAAHVSRWIEGYPSLCLA